MSLNPTVCYQKELWFNQIRTRTDNRVFIGNNYMYKRGRITQTKLIHKVKAGKREVTYVTMFL